MREVWAGAMEYEFENSMPESSAPSLGREQIGLAGVHVASEGAAQERAAAGRQHRRTGPDRVGVAGLAVHTAGTHDGTVVVDQQLEGGAVVEDPHAGTGDALALALHVVGTLEARRIGRPDSGSTGNG